MKTSKILVKDDKVVSVSVPVYFFRFADDNYVYAESPSLGITTDGKSLEEAKKMFNEALGLWIEYVDERGNIKEVLKELGWKLTKSEIIPKEEPYNIPFELLASKMVNLEISTSGLN